MNTSTNTQGSGQAIDEALALHRQGKHELAMQRYVAILQQEPANADALYYIAVLAIQEGQLEEGIKVIGRALEVCAPQARLYNLMGKVRLRQNQDADALAAFGQAIETDPNFVEAYGNRATLLAEMGRTSDALADYDRALSLRPNNAEDLCNRAGALADLGRFDEAKADLDRAIVLAPNFAPAYYNRGGILARLGHPGEALADYDRAIAIYPNMAPVHSNRGSALKEMGRLDEARASFERALSIDPNLNEAIVNRGNVAYQQGRLDEALSDYDRALKTQPESPEANHGRALACLTLGDWDTGFRLYEHRSRLKKPAHETLPHPRWTGEIVPGERLLLLCEQRLGDMIQFCRFASVLGSRGADVTLLAPRQLHRLLATLQDVAIESVDRAPPVNGHPTRWLPLMSLPGRLGVQPHNMPGQVPYLSAEQERIEHWSAWLGNEGLKIGINWGLGTPRDWFGSLRDIPLEAFATLADIPGARLISLQKGPPLRQIAQTAFGGRIEYPGDDFDAGPDAFVDTAALMMNLDLVVTCDTSIAHLAGALGRPVFTALPAIADWCWLRDRDDTPWYPTMRLFRQRQPGNWAEVLQRIAQAVQNDF